MNKRDIEAALEEDKLRQPQITVAGELHEWARDIAGSFMEREPAPEWTPEPYYYLILDCPPVVFELVQDETLSATGRSAELTLKGMAHLNDWDYLQARGMEGIRRLKVYDGITVSFDFGDGFLVFEGPKPFVEDYDLMDGDNLVKLLDWIDEGGECPLVPPLQTTTHKLLDT